MLHLKSPRKMIAATTAAMLSFQSSESRANISYSIPGSAYTQNFDSLPTTPEDVSLEATVPWTDDTVSNATTTSIPGWFLYHPLDPGTEDGNNGFQRFRIGAGAATTGSFYSFGGSASSDRALSGLNADTLSTPQNATVPPATLEASQMYIGLLLTNNTGLTLTSFSLGYTGEQWRRAGNTGVGQITDDRVEFQYSLDPAATISSPNGLYIDVNALDFASPQTTGAAGSIDGNDPLNRTVLGPVVTNIPWAPGTNLFLRWVDVNYPGPNPTAGATRGDNGLGIDDLTFTAAVPEPASLFLFGLGGIAMLASRRRIR